MKIGLSAYDVPARRFVELARAADDAGFDSLWLGEHVVLPVGYATEHPTRRGATTQHRRGPIIAPDTELVDPLVQLGAAAAVTTGITLATGMFLLPLRHPLAVARSVCTVQELAGGRFVLGAGMGWLPEEFDALGVPFAERRTRLLETIEVVRLALGGGPVRYEGRYTRVDGVQVTHRPTPVPIVLGGNGPQALRRAARLGDGWFSSGTPSPDDALRLRDELRARRAELGRTDPFEIVLRVAGADPSTLRWYEDHGVEHAVVWAHEVWPDGASIDEGRAAVHAAAAAFGLTPRR